MNKLLIFTFVIFINSIFAFAQMPEAKTADWQFYAPEKEEFSIEFPMMPEKADYSFKKYQRRYYGNFNGTYFFISSDAVQKPEQFDFVMRFVKAFQPSGEKGKNNRTKTEKFVFTDAENFYHTVITAKTAYRVYVFQTISPTANDPSADRFFANLKISESPAAADKVDKTDVVRLPSKVVNQPNAGNGNSDNSNPMNSADTDKSMAALPISKRVNAGVTILSKPRANYTDLAGFYEISGQNLFRVTFLASGEIGSVSPVNRLPFGLTEQAILAARAIRFEPAVRNGIAVTVTKAVQYSFTIY